jgi:transcriptional regulator with XRE-family HTH domain
MIGDNLKTAFSNEGLIVKEVAKKSGISKGTIDNWVNKGKEPRIHALYAVCKAINITLEQAVDGDAGAEYVRGYVQEQGWGFSPPEHIAGIVEAASMLSDEQLDYVMGLINTMLSKKESSGMTPETKSGKRTG